MESRKIVLKNLFTGQQWRNRRRRGWHRMRWLDGHHKLNGHRFRWTPAVGDGQGGLACCGSWGRKESDTTERLNQTEWRNRHREQAYGHGERGGEGEIYGKSNMETYITICKIDSQWEFAVWLRKLQQGLCINLEEWDGEGDEREVQKGGDICIPVADSCWGLTENDKIL